MYVYIYIQAYRVCVVVAEAVIACSFACQFISINVPALSHSTVTATAYD